MNIIQVSRQFAPSVGGLENVTLGLSHALQQRGHRCDVLTLQTIFNQKYVAEPTEIYDGISVFRIPHIGSKRYPIAPAVTNFVKPYDVVHIHAIDFFVDFLSVLRKRHGKPIVVNTHGGIFHTRWLYRMKQLYFRYITRNSLHRVDAVLCDSLHDYNMFKKVVDAKKLHIIGNGVDLRRFVNIQKRIKRGLIVGIGRVVENKGIERIIELLPGILCDFPEVMLIWIGEDVEGRVGPLMARANDLGVASHVQFLGQVSIVRMTELLSYAHIFVSAANYEAFGVSTIEAMGSGTIPVVTAVGIHPEVIEHYENGFICTDIGVQGIDCIKQVMKFSEAEIKQIGNNAKATAVKYSWENIVNSYITIYDDVSLG